jgi:hypothetical protein
MNLLNRLREVVTDERDIEAVIAAAAGDGAVRLRANGVVEFGVRGAASSPYARVKFGRKGISGLDPGESLRDPAAQDQLVERAKTESAHIHGSLVVSRVLLALRPLNGVYVWNNTARLIPCPKTTVIGRGLDWADFGLPPDQPDQHLGPPFPLVLEVRVPKSPNLRIEANRRLRFLDQYQYLFTLLVSGHIQPVLWSDRTWVTVRREGALENHLLHPGFVTELDGDQDDFTHVDHEPAPIYDGPDYENHLWAQDEQIFISPTLGHDLANFHSLSPEQSIAFVRACYWYSLGIQFRKEPSLATVSLASAVECLLPRRRTTTCKSCGKPLGPGPTQLFRTHLRKFGTLPSSLHRDRDDIYAARSSLLHGSYAPRVDIDSFSSQKHIGEGTMLLEIVARRALVNWLRDKTRNGHHCGETDSP